MSGSPPQHTRPGTVRWLRTILLGLGILSLIGLGIPLLSIGSPPPVDDPISAMSYVLVLGLILGRCVGPNRRAVHLAIVLYEIAALILGVLAGLAATSRAPGVSVYAFGWLLLPLAVLALALTPSARAYFWAGAPDRMPQITGPVMINVGKRLNRQMLIGGLLAVFFGGCGLYGAFAAAGESVLGRSIAGAIGDVFALIGTATLLGAVFFQGNKRLLVLDGNGIRWDAQDGWSFDFAWSELSGVRVDVAEGTPPGGATRSHRVRLMMYPNGEVHPHHPPPHQLRTQDEGHRVYRLPLGDNPDFARRITAAVQHFAPVLDQGVHTTSGVGFHLT